MVRQSIIAFIIHATLGGGGVVTYLALIILIIRIALLVLSYKFFYPLQSRYTNTDWVFKLCVEIPIGTPFYAICLLAIYVVFAFLIYSASFLQVPAIIFGFSRLALVKSLIYLQAFDRFERGTRGDAKTTYKKGSL